MNDMVVRMMLETKGGDVGGGGYGYNANPHDLRYAEARSRS